MTRKRVQDWFDGFARQGYVGHIERQPTGRRIQVRGDVAERGPGLQPCAQALLGREVQKPQGRVQQVRVALQVEPQQPVALV